MENMEETLQQKETRLGELEGQLEAKTQMASKAEQMYEEDVLQLEEQLALMKERNSELFVANHNATADIAHLRDEVTHYASTTDELEGRYRQEASRRASLEKSLKEEKDERAKEKDARAKEQDERVKERDAVEKERSRLIMEKDAADKDRGRLLMERDAAEKERVRLMMEKDVAEKEKMRLLMERDALAREKDKLELEKTRLKLEAEEDGRKWEELVKELELVGVTLGEILKIARLTSSIGDRDSTMDYLKQQINVQNDKAREIVDQYMEKLDAARKQTELEEDRERVGGTRQAGGEVQKECESQVHVPDKSLFNASQEMEQRIQERDFAREEIDKLKREVIERRADISQAKENLERWGAQNKKLSEQIKEVSDAKGHLEEMLLSATQELREKTGTINTLTAQAGDLEFRLNEQESLVASEEAKYRDQITERNTLLLTIYQYADSLVGAPQNGVSRSSSTRNIPKPNTNFPLFHEHIIAKLKTLSRLTQTFEKRAKELYDRCQEQFSVMEKQADIQSSRIDRCNKHVKNMKDNSSLSFTQAAKYRTLLDKKTVELEAARSSKIELETQITALRDKITDLSGIDVRAKHFKGRAQEMQGKLVESEEVWKSRVRELESRVKDTDDRTRRERKGAQDKIEALQENIKNLEKKLEAATRKSDNLSDLVDQYKTSLEAKTEINNLKAENVVSKLNDQLREELDEKIKALDSERQNAKDRENQYATLHEEWKKLQKQLARRDNMITKALERLENINERKEVMENVLLRQVTQDIDATLRMRADSVMGNVSDDKRPPATTEEPQPNVSKTTGSPISDRSESPFGRSRSPNQKPVGTSGGLRSKSPAVPGMARAKSVISPAPIVKKTLVNPPKTGYLSTANGKTVATKTPAATAASPVKTRKA
ncbi:hypothetical protein BC936DRAFT_139928 [Jimgerdemannia flammicorona]|uniref:Uncharacterized protein n=1 Tax=Jimgerdemannia flammicorona TaxID=994334 RepID=A0A433B932_9FUNG|nr:hypothetical protein BC936DRAFT_139928 [Jimgerdemannia flammicorona]